QMSIWAGIFAPKDTPKGIMDKLAAALDQALDDPGVQTRLADLGGSLPTKDERTPAKFDNFVKAEIARWAPILKAANVESKGWPGCHAASGTRLPKACAEGVICRHRPAASELRSKPVAHANGDGCWHGFCDIVPGDWGIRAATRSSGVRMSSSAP